MSSIYVPSEPMRLELHLVPVAYKKSRKSTLQVGTYYGAYSTALNVTMLCDAGRLVNIGEAYLSDAGSSDQRSGRATQRSLFFFKNGLSGDDI